MNDLEGFHCRKWTLFSFCLIGIVFTLVLVIVEVKLVDDVPRDAKYTPDQWNNAKKVTKGLIIGVGVMAILFNMLGLFGAYKENYCLTLTFAILMTLATLSSIGSATRQSTGWGSFVINLLVTVLAYVLANDLKKIRRSPGNYA